MSARVTGMVFDRYPNGGGEMLLALALADHAHDDGTHIFPSVAHLSSKTRQSERSVQYQLRRMEAAGWLLLVNSGVGGRRSGYSEGGRTREYRISPDWMKGADIAPFGKGATDDSEGCKTAQDRVQKDAGKGAKALHPNQEQPKATVKKSNRGRANAAAVQMAELDFSTWPTPPSAQVLADWLQLRRNRRAPVTQTVLESFGAELHLAGALGFTVDDCLRKCCNRNWQGFEAAWLERELTTTNRPTGGTHAIRRESPAERVLRHAIDGERADATRGPVLDGDAHPVGSNG